MLCLCESTDWVVRDIRASMTRSLRSSPNIHPCLFGCVITVVVHGGADVGCQ